MTWKSKKGFSTRVAYGECAWKSHKQRVMFLHEGREISRVGYIFLMRIAIAGGRDWDWWNRSNGFCSWQLRKGFLGRARYAPLSSGLCVCLRIKHATGVAYLIGVTHLKTVMSGYYTSQEEKDEATIIPVQQKNLLLP
jgi:hypothetical protein